MLFTFPKLGETIDLSQKGLSCLEINGNMFEIFVSPAHSSPYLDPKLSALFCPIVDLAVSDGLTAIALHEYSYQPGLATHPVNQDSKAIALRIMQLRSCLYENHAGLILEEHALVFFANELYLSPLLVLSNWSHDFDSRFVDQTRIFLKRHFKGNVEYDFGCYFAELSPEQLPNPKFKHMLLLEPGEKTACFLLYSSFLKGANQYPPLYIKKKWSDAPGFELEIKKEGDKEELSEALNLRLEAEFWEIEPEAIAGDTKKSKGRAVYKPRPLTGEHRSEQAIKFIRNKLAHVLESSEGFMQLYLTLDDFERVLNANTASRSFLYSFLVNIGGMVMEPNPYCINLYFYERDLYAGSDFLIYKPRVAPPSRPPSHSTTSSEGSYETASEKLENIGSSDLRFNHACQF